MSLREAIIVANTHDDPDVSIIISLPNGDYTLTLGVGSNDDEAGLIGDLDLDGTFVIQGSDEEGTVIRQTVLERRVFDLNSGDVTFSELTIKDGSTESGQNGGGIYIDANTTAGFENVTFSNNDASTDNGGAIYAAGDAVLNSVTMSESDALRGAGVFTEQGTNVVIRNSAISHNTVANSGGSEGGAIYTQGTLVISNSVLDSNAANAGPSTTSGPINSDTRGGAIFVSSTGDATIDYTVLSNNSARSDGGAIHNEGTLALNYSSLNFNLVGRFGGGLHNMGEATLIGVTVWGNSGVGPSGQDGSGGGIYGDIGSKLILSDSVVANNTSNVNTGGLHLRGIAEISDSFIVNNNSDSAIVDGGVGGISVQIGGSSDKVLFTRTVVADNLADSSNSDLFADNKNDVVSGGSNFIEEYATKKENDEFEKVSESQPADTLYSDPGIQAIILQDNRAEVVFSNEPEIISNGGDATAAITVDENQTTVTTVVVSDDAGDTHTFSLSGVDKAAFSINSISGDLTFSSVPDPDVKDTYIVDVTVTDDSASYLNDTQTLTITVVSANEAPVISSNDGGDAAGITIDENQTAVTTVTSDDVEESPRSYSVSGADATAFLIDETTGELTFITAPDHETRETYVVDVVVTESGVGGLSDTQTLTITVADVNEAPVISSDDGGATAAISVDENQTSVTTVTSDDVEESPRSYSVSGADATAFLIDETTGELTFITAPDHETRETYVVDVVVTESGVGGLSDTQTLTITVADVNEAPVISSDDGGATAAISVDENQTSVTTVTSDDVEESPRSYSVSGADATAFLIDETTGELTFITAPDHETRETYVVDVVVTESGVGGLSDTQTLTITVADVNEAPVISSDDGGATAAISVDENQTSVTTVTSDDVEESPRSYSVSGADATAFLIDETTGELTFITAPDHETRETYVVDVVVTESGVGGLSDTQTLTITVADVNEAPVISSDDGGATAAISVDENQTSVTTVTSDDVEESPRSYSVSGADATAFLIDETTGELTFITAPDHETRETYVVDVVVTESGVGGLSDTQTLTITVADVNEAPVISSDDGGATAAISVDENQTSVTTVTSDDVEESPRSYSVSGADATAFLIDETTGELTFITAPDHETRETYVVDVVVTESGVGGLSDTQTLTITVADVNEAPVISSDDGGATAAISVDENQTSVTTVTSDDVEESPRSYSVSGADATAFLIDETTGELTFITAPDHETRETYVVDVVVTESGVGGLSDTQTLTITVADVNEAPVISSDDGGATAAISVDENQTSVTTVTSDDVEESPRSYSVSGADATAFLIDETTGELTFITAPDHETRETYVVDVVVTESGVGGLSDTQTLTITVADVNEAPVISSNDGGDTATIVVDENQTGVTTVISSDAENSSRTYSVGGQDANSFLIDETTGELTFGTAPDYETRVSYEVSVSVTEAGADALTDIQVLSVLVNDVNDPPVITSNGGAGTAFVSVDEDQEIVTRVNFTDADSDSVTYSLGGADAAVFTIDFESGVLAFTPAYIKEVNDTYSVEVTVTDGGIGALTDYQTLTILVDDVNYAPAITSNGGADEASIVVEENQTTVMTISSDDSDGDNLVYSLGGADSSAFRIDENSGELVFFTVPDHEFRENFNVDVIVTETTAEELYDIQSLKISVGDVNEPPRISSNGGNDTAVIVVDENQTAVTTIVSDDVDGDSLFYSLGGIDSGDFTIDETSGVLTFLTAPDHEFRGTYIVDAIVSEEGVSGLTDTQSLTILISDVNERPLITSNGGAGTAQITLNENQTAVTTVLSYDPDDTLRTYSLAGIDAREFTIDENSGVLSFIEPPDFESRQVYSVNVVVTEASPDAFADIQTLIVRVNDVNEAPKITSNGGRDTATVFVDENQAEVTTVSSIDVDGDTRIYSLHGADADAFTINERSGVLTFNSAPDYERRDRYVIDINVTDESIDQLTDTQKMSITINDINEPPVILNNDGSDRASVAVNENQLAVATIVSDDSEGSSRIYSLGGIDASEFIIDESSGELSFLNLPDHEAKHTYIVDVIVTELGSDSLNDVQILTISVNNVNEAPSITSDGGGDLATIFVQENQLAVTSVISTDVDSDTLLYSITGGLDQDEFSVDIINGNLVFISAPDHEIQDSYEVELTVMDNAGLTDVQTLTIIVDDVNESPAITSDGGGVTGSKIVSENQLSVTIVTATDVDENDSLTYSVIGGNDALHFVIDESSGVLTFKEEMNFEVPDDIDTDNIYEVIVQVVDQQSGFDTQTVNVIVSDENDRPVIQRQWPDQLLETDSIVTVDNKLFYDEDGDMLSLSITRLDGQSLPDWIVYNQQTTELSLGVTPTEAISETLLIVADDNQGGTVRMEFDVLFRPNSEPLDLVEPPLQAAFSTVQSISGLTNSPISSNDINVSSVRDRQVIAVSNSVSSPTVQGDIEDDAIDQMASISVSSTQSILSNGLFDLMDYDSITASSREIADSNVITQYLSGNRVLWNFASDAEVSKSIFNDSVDIANLFAQLQQQDSELFDTLSADFEKQKEELDSQIRASRGVVGTAISATSSLSVGYILYMLRSGAIMSSMLTSLPAWRFVDPLPILGSLEGSLNADSESLESMVSYPVNVDKIM